MSDFDEIMDNIVTLTSDDGDEQDFEFIDLIEYEGDQYVVLIPVEETTDDEEGESVVILKYEGDSESGEENYDGALDDDVLNAVYDIFKERFADEFDFVEEDEKNTDKIQ